MAVRIGAVLSTPMGSGSTPLFDQVLAYCGLSALIGPAVLHRALADQGVDPSTARPEHYTRMLPTLETGLRTFLPAPEAERRARRLAEFLQNVATARTPDDGPPSQLPTLRTPTLHATTMVDGSRIRLSLIGTTDATAAAPLASFLGQVHATAVRTGADTVVVDLLDLYFLHTSSVRQLVLWFSTIASLPTSARYRVLLEGTAAIPWQPRTLATLPPAATDFVTVSIR